MTTDLEPVRRALDALMRQRFPGESMSWRSDLVDGLTAMVDVRAGGMPDSMRDPGQVAGLLVSSALRQQEGDPAAAEALAAARDDLTSSVHRLVIAYADDDARALALEQAYTGVVLASVAGIAVVLASQTGDPWGSLQRVLLALSAGGSGGE